MTTSNIKKAMPFKLFACELCLTEFILEYKDKVLENTCRDFLRNLIPDIHLGGIRRAPDLDLIPYCQAQRATTYFDKSSSFSFEEIMQACRECFQKMTCLPMEFLTFIVENCKVLPHFMIFFHAIYNSEELKNTYRQTILRKQDIITMWEACASNVYNDFTVKFLFIEKKGNHSAQHLCARCLNHLCETHQHCKYAVLNEERYACEFDHDYNLDLLKRLAMPDALESLLSRL